LSAGKVFALAFVIEIVLAVPVVLLSAFRKQDIPCRRTDTIIQVLIVCTVLNIVSVNAHSRPEAIDLSRLIIINR
jgi:hypothetical protein